MTLVQKEVLDIFAITEEPTSSLLTPFLQNVTSLHFHVKTMTNFKLENVLLVDLDLLLEKSVVDLDTIQINQRAEEVYFF